MKPRLIIWALLFNENPLNLKLVIIMASSEKKTYFKLGSKASMFYDQGNRFKVAGNNIVEFSGKITPKMRAAIANGHIIEVDEKEFKEYEKTGSTIPMDGEGQPARLTAPNWGSLTKGEIVEWAKENIEDIEDKLEEDEDIDDLADLTKDKLIERVKELMK
jgi:hypothetical protein